jgi:hypothetical protein
MFIKPQSLSSPKVRVIRFVYILALFFFAKLCILFAESYLKQLIIFLLTVFGTNNPNSVLFIFFANVIPIYDKISEFRREDVIISDGVLTVWYKWDVSVRRFTLVLPAVLC